MSPRTRAVLVGTTVGGLALAIALFLHPAWPGLRKGVIGTLHRAGLAPAPERAAPDAGPALEALPPLPDSGWVQGGPLPPDSLRGHTVVLALFSDTHPGAIAALPRIDEWHAAYARFGVRVIGVHVPEYAFATAPEVAERFAGRLGLTFPIVRDPSLALLSALGSRRSAVEIVIADAEGRVRHTRTLGPGERDLLGSEHALRALLREARPDVSFPVAGAGEGAKRGRRVPDVRTIRLGSASAGEGPLTGATPGVAQPFTAQFRFEVEGAPFVPYPVGWWVPGPEGVAAHRGGAAQFVAIRYDAGRVGVVAAPAAGRTSRLWILRDEKWLAADALGEDARLDAHGASYIELDAPRLYFVTRGRGSHVLKLSPEDAGVTLHALTFEEELRGRVP
jgi:hypothetical protein